MTLYHYDHCPYCVKARMIFGLKEVPVKLVALANDDEETPINLVGKKMVPILTRESESPMPESLSIIQFVDELDGPIVKPSQNNSSLSSWLKGARSYHYALAMPRWVKMGLEEFQTDSAVAYFTVRKEAYIGSFAKHLEKTPQLVEEANRHLLELEDIIKGDRFVWGELNIDDFHLFATLRCLTTTRGIEFPVNVNTYMNNLSKASGVNLHWDRAL